MLNMQNPFRLDLVARLASVERGIEVMRLGQWVGINTDPIIKTAAAETITAHAFDQRGAAPVQLLITAERAAAIGGMPQGPAAITLVPELQNLKSLRALADPTLPAPPFHTTLGPLPPGALASLALAKLARLLPAVLVTRASDAASISESDIFNHADLAAALLVRVSEAVVPLEQIADCRVIVFRAEGTSLEHIAILCGRPESETAPLIRVHSECFTGDLLGSLRCDCGAQLRGAIERIAAVGSGAILYLAQEGRGIGLANKLRAYSLQDEGLDTLDANRALGFSGDDRDYRIASAMLHQLGMTRIRLMTNSPAKLDALTRQGIIIDSRQPLQIEPNGVNDLYLETKARRFGHLLTK